MMTSLVLIFLTSILVVVTIMLLMVALVIVKILYKTLVGGGHELGSCFAKSGDSRMGLAHGGDDGTAPSKYYRDKVGDYGDDLSVTTEGADVKQLKEFKDFGSDYADVDFSDKKKVKKSRKK
ncbi:hypothetical protein M8J76_003523 [Diaphorina citri]|nr:hypothetical protein M8J76_003523 [Diaphorina citri]KAI5746411.1 hypothetical protein M8J77_003308 [Diaphorina citri]